MSNNNSVARRSPDRYSAPAVFFHWALAILIPTLIALGWYMMSVEEDPGSSWLFDLHKSLGITTATLIFLRIVWRVGHSPALLPDTVPAWQSRAARLGHRLLYLLMILMPLTGYLGASFSGDGVAFFGLPTPAWASGNDVLKEQFFAVHSISAWILLAVIVIHVLAAFKHMFNGDGVFQRMWPR
jgi:cytochrome b561